MSRQRRIILNDDGDPIFHEKSPEDFLAERFRQATGTQVDTYIIYVGDGWHPHRGRQPDPGLGDPYQVIIDAAHREGMEIFASLRMNDIHCAYDGTFGPLQRERPDLLIGEEFLHKHPYLMEILLKGVRPEGSDAPFYEPGYCIYNGLMQAFWPAYNYAKPEVRELRRSRIEEVAERYDYDGFELDFFRHPLFFKPGEERENLAAMTDLVRQARRTLNEIAAVRGRPYLLVVRIPDTPGMALHTGLDVQTWLEEHLVDALMIAGGMMPFSSRVKEFIDMAHHHGVEAYPTADVYAVGEPEFALHASPFDSYSEPHQVRAVASNFWALEGDGVYLYNWFGLPADAAEKLALLDQVGDVATLQNIDKLFQPDNGCGVGVWGYTNAPRWFPIALIHGTQTELIVGDDVQKAADEGRLDSLELRIEVANMHMNEGIDVQINGTPIPPAHVRRITEQEFKVNLHAPPVWQGINQIVVLPGKGSVGRLSSEVTWMHLSVRYI